MLRKIWSMNASANNERNLNENFPRNRLPFKKCFTANLTRRNSDTRAEVHTEISFSLLSVFCSPAKIFWAVDVQFIAKTHFHSLKKLQEFMKLRLTKRNGKSVFNKCHKSANMLMDQSTQNKLNNHYFSLTLQQHSLLKIFWGMSNF